MKPIWWLPTFGFVFFLAIQLSMLFPMMDGKPMADRIFEDPGVGRHLRTALVIVETHQIPRTDPLSFTKAGQPWTDFEWGFETTIGELYRAGGLALVCAFCYAVFGATILNVYRLLLQSGLSLSVVIFCTGIACLTLHLHFAVRPVLFTYLFMALVVEVWQRRARPLKRDWFLLPVIFAAWANIHAGWLAALLYLAISMFGRLLDRILGRVNGEQAPLIPWLGLTLLCALSTLLNPWGWGLHRQVLFVATSLKSAALWDEYRPPNFGTPSGADITMSAIAILFILIIIVMARGSKRAPAWRWETVLPVIFFLYMGLRAQRHVLLLMEIAVLPVARDLQVLLQSPAPPFVREWFPLLSEIFPMVIDRFRQFQARQRAAGGDAWLALVAALVLAALFVRTPIGNKIEVGSTITPKLVAFLKEHPDRFHRPLTTTGNAGPLLWNMRPDFRVSIDDRGDFYGDDAVYAFNDMTHGSRGWDETLKKGNYDSLIIEPYLPLNQLLHFLPEWKEVYRDKDTVVYWKD